MAKRKMAIESGSQQLEGRLFVPAEAKGSAVLLVHGFGVRGRTCEQYAKLMKKRDIASLSFDLSGHGDSTGDNTKLSVNDHVEDVRNAYDYLVSNNEVTVDPKRVGIAGMSYGGYLATLLSDDRPAKSLLLRSPPLYPKALQARPRWEYTDEQALQAEPETDNPALEALCSFAGKVSLITSEFDTIVSVVTTTAYSQAAYNCEVTVLKGAQHSLGAASQQQFKSKVETWAAEL